ncbi:MAG TPA: rhomboid family intramembrane serine protease [Xanthobacteraceae bacterium]|nr:rhomboid family intramembrane serine protease [Xanthobacteraceae bacterium]
MFNIPSVVVATIGALVLVHAVRTLGLSPRDNIQLLLLFSFIPARYDSSLLAPDTVPGGWGADIWTFVSYAFIHGDWIHLGLNSIWLLAFGSAVARRFGATRFLAFFAITAAAGAGVHLLAHAGDVWPMVGASAAISGYMAAAMRFVFQAGGPLGWMGGGTGAYHTPAAPLTAALRNPNVLVFLGVWFGLNLLFGASSFSLADEGQSIAWQAHIGGFLAGLLLFPVFDPIGPRPHADAGGEGAAP